MIDEEAFFNEEGQSLFYECNNQRQFVDLKMNDESFSTLIYNTQLSPLKRTHAYDQKKKIYGCDSIKGIPKS